MTEFSFLNFPFNHALFQHNSKPICCELYLLFLVTVQLPWQKCVCRPLSPVLDSCFVFICSWLPLSCWPFWVLRCSVAQRHWHSYRESERERRKCNGLWERWLMRERGKKKKQQLYRERERKRERGLADVSLLHMQLIVSGRAWLSGEPCNLFHQRLLPNKLTKTSTAAWASRILPLGKL